MKLKDFLLKYYQQLGINKMPIEARAQFADLVKNGQLTKEMEKWIKGGFIPDPKDHPDDFKNWSMLARNYELPDANSEEDVDGEIQGLFANAGDDGEWKKMFSAFQNAARGLDENREDYEDNKPVIEFLEEYFGETALFSAFQPTDDTKQTIKDVVDLFRANQKEMGPAIMATGMFDETSDMDNFIDDLEDEKYINDAKVRNLLKNKFAYQLYEIAKGQEQVDPKPVWYEPLVKLINDNKLYGDIIEGFNDKGDNISPLKLGVFKRNYQTLLNDLWGKKKLFDEFQKYDGGKVSKPLAEAMGKTDFKDKEKPTYLAPKLDDELTWSQQISKNFGDTFDDYLKKYLTLRGDRMWHNKDAELIVKAIDGVKLADGKRIKPTDGLGAILDNAAKIKENMQFKSPNAIENFDYFVKLLEKLKTTMPKAFAGALHSGKQLDAIVSEMILTAVEDGDKEIEKLKVGLEVLSAVKYGIANSKIADALGAESITILSDKNLTWNKNDGIQFATKFIDWAANAGLHLAERVGAMVGNAVKLNWRGGKAKMLADASARLEERYRDERAGLVERITENKMDLHLKHFGYVQATEDILDLIQQIENAEAAGDTAMAADLKEKYDSFIKDREKILKDGWFLNTQIDKDEAELGKDRLKKYKELMGWWRFIDGGRETGVISFEFGSRKAHQENWDAVKAARLSNFQNNYQMAA